MTDKNYDDKLFTEVDRWTRAGKRGKELFCPKCGSETRIYHFAWSTVKCGNCKKFVEKKPEKYYGYKTKKAHIN